MTQRDSDRTIHNRHGDSERHEEDTNLPQVTESPGGHHPHFEQEQGEDSLERSDEESRRRIKSRLAREEAHDQPADQQYHTAAKQRFVQRHLEHRAKFLTRSLDRQFAKHDSHDDCRRLHDGEKRGCVFLVRLIHRLQKVRRGDERHRAARSVVSRQCRRINGEQTTDESQDRITPQRDQSSQDDRRQRG